jgi:NDP-sugar pyrophosphorylase family protein
MKAIIFAAGMGSRLKPHTNNCPKALVNLNGQPLLWHAITKLTHSGATQIIVNIHHFGEQIIDYLNSTPFEIPILISDEREKLLDTGGALLKASLLLESNSPIIAYNVDIISSVNLKEVYNYHQKHDAIATLVVRKRETTRYLMFDKEMKLNGWKNENTGETKISSKDYQYSNPWAFSGIQILSPEFINLISESGKFSIIEPYLRLAKDHLIMGYPDKSNFWLDLGKPGQIELAEIFLNK